VPFGSRSAVGTKVLNRLVDEPRPRCGRRTQLGYRGSVALYFEVSGSGRELQVACEDVRYAGQANPPLEDCDGFRRKGGEVEGLDSVPGFEYRSRTLPGEDLFSRAGLAAFEGLAEDSERWPGFLAGLCAGFVFRVGMRRALLRSIRDPGRLEVPGVSRRKTVILRDCTSVPRAGNRQRYCLYE
jgi:hypothetical protein